MRSSRRTKANSAAVRRASGQKPERALEAARRSGRGRCLQGRRTRWSPRPTADWASRRRPRHGSQARERATCLSGMIAALRARGCRLRSGLRRRLAARPRGGDCRPADDRRRSRRCHPAGASLRSMNELIVRIAARGDGVTASGRHVPFGVPGDAVLDDGALAFGPHHQEPPCRHFPECGGCQLQHADDEAYRGYLVSRVERALAQHGLATADSPALSVAAEQPPPGNPQGAEGRARRVDRLQCRAVAPHHRHARVPHPAAGAVRAGRAAARSCWRTCSSLSG